MNIQIKTWLLRLIIITTSFSLYAVDPIPLSNADAVLGVITVSATGNYQVIEDVVYPIVITVDNVSINLNHHTVTHNSATDSIVIVNSLLQEVNVFNGCIRNTSLTLGTGSGVLIGPGASSICLHDLKIYNCGKGVYCAGQEGSEILRSEFCCLDCVANATGIALDYTDETVIKECNALLCTTAGFELFCSEANCFYGCHALKTSGAQSVVAFQSNSGSNNLFQDCIAQETKTSSTSFGDTARGFVLTGTEKKTKIIRCGAYETDSISTPTAMTYGIHLAPTLLPLPMEHLDTLPTVNTPFCVRWSPDNKLLAITQGLDVVIQQWDGATLTPITTITLEDALVAFGLNWSPDGKYLAINGVTKVLIYSFDGTSLSAIADSGLVDFFLFNVSWSPNGQYLVGYGSVPWGTESYIKPYSFDGTALELLATTTISSVGLADEGAAAWSPDGSYLSISLSNTGVRVYKFNSSGSCTSPVNFSFPFIKAACWSPCGRYLAVGDDTGSVGMVKVLAFDGTTLTQVAQLTGYSYIKRVDSLCWSPDGRYIMVAGEPSSGSSSRYLMGLVFDGSTLASGPFLIWPVVNGSVPSLDWSAHGKYIAAVAKEGYTVEVYGAMYSPENCLIDRCNVSTALSSGQSLGRGIVGGGSNIFLSNKVSSNGVNYSYGIPNVYDGRFEIERNVVQPFDNISLPTTL